MLDLRTIIPDRLKEILSDAQVKIYIALVLTIVLAGIYFIFVIYPNFSELSRTSNEINKLNFNINLVNTRVRQLDEMMKQLNTLNEEYKGYSKGLPNEREIPEFLENLSLMAKETNVKILSITPSELKTVKQEKEGYYQELPIVITAKSGYHELGNFIASLEEGERFLAITNLEMRNDDKFPRRHNVRIALKTYVSVEDEKK